MSNGKKPELNIVDMPKEEDAAVAAAASLCRNMAGYIKLYEARAEMRYGAFKAHLKAGFSKEEAYGILQNEIQMGDL